MGVVGQGLSNEGTMLGVAHRVSGKVQGGQGRIVLLDPGNGLSHIKERFNVVGGFCLQIKI